MVEYREAEEHGEVEWPDAQDTAHIEGWNVDLSGAVALPEEEVGDEECAEQEEHRHSERANGAYAKRPEIPRWIGADVVHAMEGEDTEEGEEAEGIEFGPVEGIGFGRWS